jgi:hypothetical protein
MSDVRMFIKCELCGQSWDIDHDPDSCICDDDVEWKLVVLDDNDD